MHARNMAAVRAYFPRLWPPPRLWDAVMERGSDSLDMTVEETEKGEKGDKNNG